MARKYTLRKRAESQAETRRRITEAVVDLHATIGPARTTISEVAERAGVQRLTVYRHFPDETALIHACSAHFRAANPLPDPSPWVDIQDPECRLKTGLAALYGYYRRTEPMLVNVWRDAPQLPALAEQLAAFPAYLETLCAILTVGWSPEDEPPTLLRAALGHAVQFLTWRSLAGHQGVGLSDEQAVQLMVRLVRCSVTTEQPSVSSAL